MDPLESVFLCAVARYPVVGLLDRWVVLLLTRSLSRTRFKVAHFRQDLGPRQHST